VSPQTDFQIISHVDRPGPPNSPDLNPCDYCLHGFFKEKIFPKKGANSNGIESTNLSGLQGDNRICAVK
jgi:hypothetical protein